MNGGVVSVCAAVVAVSGTLIWSMSIHDPYWRLFKSESVPAPAYVTDADLSAVLAMSFEEHRNPDTEAVSRGPAIVLAGGSGTSTADMVQLPDPVMAEVPPLDETPGTATLLVAVVPESGAPQIAAAPAPISDMFDALASSAFVPPPPFAQERLAASGRTPAAIFDVALAPVAAPSTPAQPRIRPTEDTEIQLTLERAQRADLQRRLALAGFDPRGFDGIFGPNTRQAITDFQIAWDFPATGYLEDSVVAELNQRTEDAYQAMRRRAATAPSASPELAAEAPEIELADSGEQCARRSDGRIIERQGLACDMAGLAESFVSLGRNTLGPEGEDDEDSEVSVLLAPSFGTHDIDR